MNNSIQSDNLLIQFINCFHAEWLKKKRSLAYWLVITGGFFTPVIIIVVRVIRHTNLRKLNLDPLFWQKHWILSWESMAIFLLPMGIILSASLIAQLEYKNNTWKQWHTTPQKYVTMFFAKLCVILVMMAQFFVLFNIGIYLSGVIPGLFFNDVPYPPSKIPVIAFLKSNLYFFITCLPMIGIQHLVSLQFKNFLVSVGGGILLWITAIGSLRWEYGHVIPYSHGLLFYMKTAGRYKTETNLLMWSLSYFLIAVIISFCFYLTKREKG